MEEVKKPVFEMQPVTSSNIAAIGYRKETQTLRVKFNNGTTYEYNEVPEQIVKDLLAAGSVGSFFNKNIRPQWQGKKLVS